MVEAGSLSEAAHRLELAQPALSLQMRELESEMGVRLLDRHSRGVRPTPAGELLYRRVGELGDFLGRMTEDVRAAGGFGPAPVVIGMTPSLIRLVGVEVLRAAAETGAEGPGLRLVEALSVALTQGVERGEIDIALAYEVEERPGLVREAVILDELLLVTAPGQCPPAVSFREAVSRELCFAGDNGIVASVRRMAERLSLVPRIVSNVQSVSAIRTRIAEGGASLLSYGTAADGVRRGFFAVSRIRDPALVRTLYIVRRRDHDPGRLDRRIGALLAGMVRDIHRASAPYATLIDPRYEGAEAAPQTGDAAPAQPFSAIIENL